MTALTRRAAMRFRHLVRHLWRRLGPGEPTSRDGPPPILTQRRLAELFAILDASIARRERSPRS
jgi:hypothetical protein